MSSVVLLVLVVTLCVAAVVVVANLTIGARDWLIETARHTPAIVTTYVIDAAPVTAKVAELPAPTPRLPAVQDIDEPEPVPFTRSQGE